MIAPARHAFLPYESLLLVGEDCVTSQKNIQLRGRLARSGVHIEESGERVKSHTRGKRGEKPLGFFSRVNFSPAFYYANARSPNLVMTRGIHPIIPD